MSAKNIIDLLNNLNVSYLKAGELKERYYSVSWRITTGSSELDKLLDGGIRPFKIYEFFGVAGTGKTQLAMQLTVTSLIEDSSIRYNSIYIDTERGFNTDKILKIAARYTDNPHLALKSIYYSFSTDPDDFIHKLISAKKICSNCRLLIIDNIAVPLQNLRNKDPNAISHFIRQIMRIIADLINAFSISVVLTNRVYSKVEPLMKNVYQPYGGITLESFIDKEILLIKENTFIRAVDISSTKATAFFKVSEGGIIDI
jgi:DNA repair protein RAD51